MTEAKELPILFNSDMVKAVLKDRKSKTRRTNGLNRINIEPDLYQYRGQVDGIHQFFGGKYGRNVKCPYGQPGDRLWVRETHAIVPRTAYRQSEGVEQVLKPYCSHDAAIFKEGWDRSPPGRWRPSIHMPRWASRITLEITGVRVERLQDISEEDAKQEGCNPLCKMCGNVITGKFDEASEIHAGCIDEEISFYFGFRYLWSKIKGKESWNANPWVWVIEFKRVD